MAEAILEVKDLKTVIRDKQKVTTIVDVINFEIGPKEVVALVGESGCGKSMTSLSIMQLLPKTGEISKGEIRFRGRNLVGLNYREMSQIRGRQIAMIFQEPMTSLNPVLTIGLQLTESIVRHLKVSKTEAVTIADEWLRRVGFPEPKRIRKEFPHRLSGGMRQRIMLAMAMSCKPDLLIADEPTTALDVTIQAQVLDLIRQLLRESDMSVLFITHDLGVVAEMATRVIVMYAGQIVETTDVRTLFTSPIHPYTKGLLNSTPRMHGKIEKLSPISGTVPPAGHYPEGCRFMDRCPMATAECREKVPELREYRPGHKVRCILV
ncbi:ABC transporter ATP-binding protein [Paenibacillus sp. GP183]|jgi:peptide/nickel transport system ATP-binding protein|uniref:ABC transporter ATP-binding protein n=1 Tax=Paenibacillus sp. GP183 TaxID=1882751 RepID=UPI00089D45A8|nr:ABC transporter ATP-binding protein [Paenibacillus sp. GP183]SEB85060.1 oligopeptide/dipeptide ABC transporter, ATP-binding protein, C-terminal domain-containing protein [Paenibacillus sp. GP183]